MHSEPWLQVPTNMHRKRTFEKWPTAMHEADKNLSDALFEEIRTLEESLWKAKSRFNNVLMDQVFAQDFFEFSRSGRTYARYEMLLEPTDFQEIAATIPLPEFRARHITDDVVQTTYVSEVVYDSGTQRGNRSSIWSRIDGGWRLRFHQGTPC